MHDTQLRFGEVIVAAGWGERFDEAQRLLNEFVDSFSKGLFFPMWAFHVLLTEPQIAERQGDKETERQGDKETARRDAERALNLLADNPSIAPRHPGVGQRKTDEATFRELERLASSDLQPIALPMRKALLVLSGHGPDQPSKGVPSTETAFAPARTGAPSTFS